MVDAQLLEEGILAVPGFKATGVSCGLKTGGSKDISLLISDTPCTVAMAFTKNRIQGAHIPLDKERINNPCHAVLINSGNANCLTGQQGLDNAQSMISITEELLKIPEGSCLIASTGIIGQQLNMVRVKYGIERLVNVIPNESNIRNFGAGIATSSARQKNIAYKFQIDNQDIFIGISAKGESMIKPWLETMHGTLITLITTNINISQPLLQKALSFGINKSFNRISIDNDISPNDSVFLLTNKTCNMQEIAEESDPRYSIFTEILHEALLNIAKLLLRQGLGTTKLLNLIVTNAESDEQAELLVRNIAESYQIKTMLLGQRILWYKIINVIAYSNINFDLQNITIKVNKLILFENGTPNQTNIALSLQDMSNIECTMELNLNMGTASSELWTCDLSHDYVKFNSLLSDQI